MNLMKQKPRWHTGSLTQEHDKHVGLKCYCKNCSCYWWGEETIPVYGAVYCKQCEIWHGQSTYSWVHEICITENQNCGEECPVYDIQWM